MKLFSCEDRFSVVIEPEILLIKVSDHTWTVKETKAMSTKELAYLYFMYEVSSDFQQTGHEERSSEVIKHKPSSCKLDS
jgi:hypothetical protein